MDVVGTQVPCHVGRKCSIPVKDLLSRWEQNTAYQILAALLRGIQAQMTCGQSRKPGSLKLSVANLGLPVIEAQAVIETEAQGLQQRGKPQSKCFAVIWWERDAVRQPLRVHALEIFAFKQRRQKVRYPVHPGCVPFSGVQFLSTALLPACLRRSGIKKPPYGGLSVLHAL